MAKPKNKKPEPSPAAGSALPPVPLIPPTPEELRRQHAETVGRERLRGISDEVILLIAKDLKKVDITKAIAACGEAILSLALQTQGRMRAISGETDALVEAKIADFNSKARKSIKLLEGPYDLTSFEEVVDTMKPALDSITRLVKDLDVPGVKLAITPTGPALFDPEGQPTQAASAAPLPPAPASAPEPEPKKPEPPAPTPGPANVSGREIQTLGMGPVIDVEPEPAHPFDGLGDEAINDLVTTTLDKLEEAGVEEGLKRKDRNKHYQAWSAILPFVNGPDDEDLPGVKAAFLLLLFALEVRKPISWDIPTEKEVFDHQRKLAIASGE